MPYNNISNPSTHPNNNLTYDVLEFQLGTVFQNTLFLYIFWHFKPTDPPLSRGPEVGWEENGGGQTSSPGEVLHTVGKHKQETCSLSGVCKLQNRSTRVSDIWCEGNWPFFIFGSFWDWKKGITFWVILTNGLEQTPILGPGYPIFF